MASVSGGFQLASGATISCQGMDARIAETATATVVHRRRANAPIKGIGCRR
ncbi:hypothetical protein HQ394_08870 [Defluviicoccus vanus]|uniref:Uncharacterized protein n=1 Tax=Defluviicoccus vanus TaxID=111831 RepID=A0A7H1N126_9PROT|nr:hypothetical protein HQ394_08870 [Defluviicoccus vanus]